jgi:hypothetical protein
LDNAGLNGILVQETENQQKFVLRADDWALPAEQAIYVMGTFESSSPTNQASAPLCLKVRRPTLASATPAGTTTNR